MIIAPSILYFALHLLGWFFPAWLWGVDQFHYYPWPLMAGFVGSMLLLFAGAMSCSAGRRPMPTPG
jgi:hypothetical protein